MASSTPVIGDSSGKPADVPVLGADECFSVFLERLELWMASTTTKTTKMVPTIVNIGLGRSQATLAYQVAMEGWRDATERAKWVVDSAQAFEDFKDYMLAGLGVSDFAAKGARELRFIDARRHSSESYESFLERFNGYKASLERDSSKLLTLAYLPSMILYHGLRLSHAESQLLRTKIDLETTTYPALVGYLKQTIFAHKIAGKNSQNTQIAAYVGDSTSGGDWGADSGDWYGDSEWQGDDFEETHDAGDAETEDSPCDDAEVEAEADDTTAIQEAFAAFYRSYKGGKRGKKGGKGFKKGKSYAYSGNGWSGSSSNWKGSGGGRTWNSGKGGFKGKPPQSS